MEFPLIAAVASFVIVVLASTAVFLYLGTRESVQTWRRRADGRSMGGEESAAEGGYLGQVQAQLHALLEWAAKLNQPSNIEKTKATRRMLISAGYRSAKAPVFYTG